MRQISEAVLEYYPDHLYSYSNIAVSYLLTGAYEKALTSLLKAHKLVPEDAIILNNLGICYSNLDQKEKAIEYLSKAVTHGEGNVKAGAQKLLDELSEE
ncbi:MAG: tetratricopeptide repeat protein [Bacteroidota bacterium]